MHNYIRGAVFCGKITMLNIIECLLWAVTEAERQLGGGTGKLKLRTAYDGFIIRYPYITKFIAFSTFSVWVDIVLPE